MVFFLCVLGFGRQRSGVSTAMSKDKFNRVQVLFNREHPPYLYGALHIVDGDIDNQRLEKPFVISKRRADGGETVFGTVARTMQKIWSQLEKLQAFRSDAERRLEVAGVKPIAGTDGSELPLSPIGDKIIDEQEDLIEDVLVSVSVNVRVLADIFPRKMKRAKANVYDYDGKRVGNIELNRIANLLLHNRYILIRYDHVVDLFSDEKFLSAKPQLGLKVNFLEYLDEVQRALDALTVKDLTGKLFGATTQISSKSNIKDIVFLTQNLYTLGGLAMTANVPGVEGPLKSILDKVAAQILEAGPKPAPGEVRRISVVFTTPRFTLEPDLNNKQIRVHVEANGQQQSLVMGYREFFKDLGTVHGNGKLYSNFQHGRPSRPP